MNLRSVQATADGTKPKLQGLFDTVTKGQVKLTEKNGEFRSTYDILKDLGKAWGNLNSQQKSQIEMQVAGKHQANILDSLLQNYQDLEKVKETADTSMGSAMREQDSYMNSISAKLNKLKEDVKGVFLDLGNTDVIKDIIDGVDLAISGVRGLINTFGGLPTVIGLATGAMTLFNKEFRNEFENIFNINPDDSKFRNALQAKIDSLQQFKIVNEDVKKEIDGIDKALEKASKEYASGTTSTEAYGRATEELKKRKEELIRENTVEIGEMSQLNNAYKAGDVSSTGYAMRLTSLRAKLIAAKIGMEALKIATIALESVMTMGLSLIASFAVEGIIKGFSAIQKAIHMTRKQLAEFNDDLMNKFSGNIETVSKSQKLLDNINQTKVQMGNTQDASKQAELKKELIGYERDLAKIMPEAANGFDQEGHAIVTDTAAVNANIIAKRQAAEDEARDFMKKNKNLVEHINLYIKTTKKIIDLEKEKNNYIKQNEGKSTFSSKKVEDYDKQIDKLRDKIKNYSKEAADAQQLISGLTKLGVPKNEIKNIIGENTFNALKRYNDSMNDIQKQQYAMSGSSKKAGISIDELTDKINKQSKAVSDAAKDFDKYGSELKVIKEAMKELRRNGKLSADTMSKVLNSGDPRLIATLRDSNTALKNMGKLASEVKKQEDQACHDAINGAVNTQKTLNMATKQGVTARKQMAQDETNAKSQSYANDVNNQANAEGIKTNNTASASQDRININVNEVNNNSTMYGNDVNNQGGAEGAKVNNTSNASGDRTEINGNEQAQKAGQYANDVNNHSNAEGAKVNNANGAGEQLVRSNDNVVNNLGGGYQTDVANWRKALSAKLAAANSFADKVNIIFSSIWEGLKSIFSAGEKVSQGKIQGYKADSQNLFGNLDLTKPAKAIQVDTSVDGGSYSQESSNHAGKYVGYDDDEGGSGSSGGGRNRRYSGGGSGYKPKKYKSSGGSGSSGGHGNTSHSSESVNIEDIETEVDRYKSLNDAISDIDNSLDEYKAKEELANSDDKLRYFEKEIDLNKDKKNAIDDLISAEQKEARELENKLKKQGLDAHDGDIDNYTERLNQIKNRINSMSNSNKAKEKAKKDYEELVKSADRYFELTSNEIPKLKQQWLEVDKTIRDTRKEYITMMADTERSVTDIIKNELEKRKTAIDKTTDSLSKAIDEEQKLFDNQNDDEEFQRQLAEKQDALNKITSDIDATRRDDSAAGQTKLQDLLQQKQEAEKDLNDFLRDRQKTEADKAFDDEKDKIDKLREDKLKEIEDTYTPEKITNMAKDMIKNGYTEIEGEVIKLSDAITNYYKDQGDLFADSSLKMQDFIDKLKMTNKLYKDLLDMTKEVGVKDVTIKNNGMILQPDLALKLINLPKAGEQKPNITVKSELNVGTVNKADVDELRKMLNDSEKRILDKIIENMSVR